MRQRIPFLTFLPMEALMKSRIKAVDASSAPSRTKETLSAVENAIGHVPNLIKCMAQAPNVLEGYLRFKKNLEETDFGRELTHRIALAVAGENACDYCASAHTALAELHGIGQDELALNLRATSRDPRVAKALDFALLIVQRQGMVTDRDLDKMRMAGFTDSEITQIVGLVAINIFTNYFNHVAKPELDFPAVDVTVQELLVANW